MEALLSFGATVTVLAALALQDRWSGLWFHGSLFALVLAQIVLQPPTDVVNGQGLMLLVGLGVLAAGQHLRGRLRTKEEGEETEQSAPPPTLQTRSALDIEPDVRCCFCDEPCSERSFVHPELGWVHTDCEEKQNHLLQAHANQREFEAEDEVSERQHAAQKLVQVRQTSERLLEARRIVLKKLKELDGLLTSRKLVVTGIKTGGAALAVLAVPAFFVFPPAAAGLGAASAVLGVSASTSHFILQKIAERTFTQALEEDTKEHKAFEQGLVDLSASLAALSDMRANGIEEPLREVWECAQALANVGWTSFEAANSAMQVLDAYQLVQIIKTAGNEGTVKMGTGFARLIWSEQTFVKTRIFAMGSNAAKGVKIVASTGAKALGCVTAIVTVADVVWSWQEKDATQEQVRALIGSVEESVLNLEVICEKA